MLTHLSDQVGTFCVLALDRLEEFRRARPGDGSEVLLELFLGHTDTRVCESQNGLHQLSPRSGMEEQEMRRRKHNARHAPRMTILPPSASAMTLTFKLGAGAMMVESVSETSRTFSSASFAFETAAAARQFHAREFFPCSATTG